MVEKFRRLGWRRAPLAPSDKAKRIEDRKTQSGPPERVPWPRASLPMRRFPPPWTVEALDGGIKGDRGRHRGSTSDLDSLKVKESAPRTFSPNAIR
jgi:hypothetical protein